METILKLSTSIQLTLDQMADLVKQLSPRDKARLVSLILEDNEVMSHDELKARVREGLQDVKLHKEGKIKLNTLSEFLADV